MATINGIKYDNVASGYDFGLSDNLDELQETIRIKTPNDRQGYTLDNHPVYSPDEELNKAHKNSYDLKPEHRARRSKFTDPFTPNFKLFIDFDKPYGLFADESKVNSALAYMKRVFGQDSPRYLMLKTFIEQFKLFLKEYDFLILNAEGLDELYSIYNKHTYVEESEIKLNIVIRETITMQLMGLINLYNSIWFDPIRGVEVLPDNLRRFDLYVMVYSAGYFNSLLYDIENPLTGNDATTDDEDQQRQYFPTVYKLEQLRQLNKFNLPNIHFNTFVIEMIDAQFDAIESGKKMFGDVTNEMSGDFVKNNLAFTSRFIGTTGKFAQYDNGIDLMSLLILESNSKNGEGKSYFKSWASKAYSALRKEGIEIINSSVSSVFNTVKGLVSPTSPIGNGLSLLSSPEEIAKKISGAVSVATNGAINKYVDKPANWLQSMVQQNFRPDILSDLMHEATDTLYGTAINQKREIENLTDLMRQLPSETNITPQDFNIKFNTKQEQVGVAKNIEVKDIISEYVTSENHKNIEVEPEIPEYQEIENKNNIEFKKSISEYKETENHKNIEVEPEIPEYISTDNNQNIEYNQEINEYQQSNNQSNIEQKDKIPEYISTDDSSTSKRVNQENIEYQNKINTYVKEDNSDNIEYQKEIESYPKTYDIKNIDLNTIDIQETIESYPNENKQQINPEYKKSIDNYPTNMLDSNIDNPEYKNPITNK